MKQRKKNKPAGKGKKKDKFFPDVLMQNVASHLIRDFQTNLCDPLFANDVLAKVIAGNIVGIRTLPSALDFNAESAYEFKARYQVESLFKRYRFRKDLYSDHELELLAIAKFLATQDRLAAVDLDSLPANCQRVLDLAARYVSKVLGPYSDEEHRSLCRFGRRASVGIPGRVACEAARWEMPLSGSYAQIAWFDSEMSQVACVQEYWTRQREGGVESPTYRAVGALKLTLVPKTYKSLRCIMPNTTIGSYMSYGLGMMIRKRLQRIGQDVATLQQRHKDLARQSSVHNLYATADLSSASDSITVALVKRLFPPDWFEILDQSRIGAVVLPNGAVRTTLTHCTMGVGYTFPLQSLVFLALLKAIQLIHYGRLDQRLISVYGDDLIYASRMHSLVEQYFPQFGFVINLDKTYHEGGFRESCGGDYFHGVDVRPFQPQSGPVMLRRNAYEAMLYKYANGLLARWSEYEIGRTLAYLCSEIERIATKIKVVPADFPDESGVKCTSLSTWDFLKYAKCVVPQHVGHGLFRFPYLRHVPEKRKEERHDPYLWLALGGCHNDGFDYHHRRHLRVPPDSFARIIDLAHGIQEDERPLVTKKDIPITLFTGISGEPLHRTSTYVTISDSGCVTRQSGLSCFGSRRS